MHFGVRDCSVKPGTKGSLFVRWREDLERKARPDAAAGTHKNNGVNRY